MDRLRADASAQGAEGVVGVELTDDVSLTITMEMGLVAVGTAVRRDSTAYEHASKPAIVIPLKP